jgi:hypothetical protein
MGRENWKCPHVDCNAESSRRGNCKRHIKNLHHCECSPVKRKSSTVICQSRPEDTQFKGNASGNQDPYYSRSTFSQLPKRDYNSLKSCPQDYNSDGIVDNTQKDGGITSNRDFIDTIYPTFKKLKERNDKILEMRTYFETYGSAFTFPFYSPLNIFDNCSINSILPRNVSSVSANNSNPSLLKSRFSPPSLSRPNKVIGFEIYNCGICLESESLPVMYNPDVGKDLFKKKHVCEPYNVNNVRNYPRFMQEDICFYNVISSSDQITNTVKEWCRGRVYLVCFRKPSRENPLGTIDLTIKENQYSWLIRAIKQESTVLNEKELKEFLDLTKNVTYCCLSISFVQDQQKSKKESIYFFLNYKPCIPSEN